MLCQTRSGLVYFVPADEFPIYLELTGLDGAFNPGGKTRLVTVANDDEIRECTAHRPVEAESLTDVLIDTVAPSAVVIPMFPEPDWMSCQRCGKPMCHPDSLACGLCGGCGLRLQAQLRRPDGTPPPHLSCRDTADNPERKPE